MKKIVLILFCSVVFTQISYQADAQIIDSLKLLPPNPTGADTVKVICYVTIPASDCWLDSSKLNFSGNAIELLIYYGFGISSAWCPRVDTIMIGKLTGGINYSLEISAHAGILNDDSIIGFYVTAIPTFPLVGSATHVSCHDSSDGTACVNTGLLGGTPPYSIVWSTGQTSDCIAGLGAGSYCVTVTDANSEKADTCFTIIEPPLITLTFLINNPTCSICSDGSIEVLYTGGIGTLLLLWYPPVATTFNYASGLPAGLYKVCGLDANGCLVCDSVILSSPVLVSEKENSSLFKVHPNPNLTRGAFTISFSKAIKQGEVVVFNVMGEKVYSETFTGKEKTVDTNLSTGIYFVQLRSPEGQWTEKMVVE